MRLIGMLDSPFVRRVAISLRTLGLEYSHEPLSVFRHYEAFAAINPVVKAPTLITDDGMVLMESSLILEYLERLVPAERRLTPADPSLFAQAQYVVGLALAACEKTVQIVYERNFRPEDKQHQPWVDRLTRQLHEAYRLLELRTSGTAGWLFGDAPLQPDITTAVAWRFSAGMVPDLVRGADYPGVAHFSARAETLPAFLKAPFD